MKIGIVGLGAVGGFIASRLAAAGNAVCALARGATLDAVRRDGLLLVEGPPQAPRETRTPLTVSADAAALGPQDLVILSVKATGLAAVAPAIAPLLGPGTTVLTAMNGVPWWFFQGLDESLAAREWQSIDPGHRIASAIPAASILGAVVHFACASPHPGVVRHAQGDRLIVGEPAGGDSERCRRVVGVLREAGLQAEVSARIQQDIWFKLWGNMTFNPISAITGATADRIIDDPLVSDFVVRAMREAAAVGGRIGLPIAMSPTERLAITRKLGAFRTSMLQDVDAGRAVELDALVAAVVEIGRAVGVPTPDIDALLGLARLHARVRGLYPASVAGTPAHGV
jgi:2-dehydropantoate 2-reductase